MSQVIDKKVAMHLSGLNGNAFVILGTFRRNAKRQGWTEQEVDAVTEEATSGDYDHLLQTIMAHTKGPEVSDER